MVLPICPHCSGKPGNSGFGKYAKVSDPASFSPYVATESIMNFHVRRRPAEAFGQIEWIIGLAVAFCAMVAAEIEMFFWLF
jgi:hypothetical protein